MPVVHRFDPPERFVAGTVGEPGQRTFFLQAREGTRITSVSLEKQQVSALAERIDELARRLDVQEMAVVTWAYDEGARRQSYRLLAKAMGFAPGMP